MDTQWLQADFLENSIKQWVLCGLVLVLTLIFNRYIARLASRISYRIFKEVSQARFFEEFSRLFQRPFVHVINLMALYLAFSSLNFPETWNLASPEVWGVRRLIHTLYIVVLIVAITRLFLKAAEFMEHVYHRLDHPTISKDLATFLKELTRVLVFIISFFALLAQAFEVNITALVASLGIGGLAIALAAQDTLANLIGSFIIYLDKPFQVGETIELGEIKGVVEKIGFRTTRIRTLDRTLLIVPNKKIIDSNLNNLTQSNQRRVRFVLNLTYQSEPEQILQIIDDIKIAIHEESPLTAPETIVRFIEFDQSSLNLIVVFFVNSNEYEVMIDVKERINLKIMNIVRNRGCQFAFPSQTVYLAK